MNSVMDLSLFEIFYSSNKESNIYCSVNGRIDPHSAPQNAKDSANSVMWELQLIGIAVNAFLGLVHATGV